MDKLDTSKRQFVGGEVISMRAFRSRYGWHRTISIRDVRGFILHGNTPKILQGAVRKGDYVSMVVRVQESGSPKHYRFSYATKISIKVEERPKKGT